MSIITSDMVIEQLGLKETAVLSNQITSIIPGAIQKAFAVTYNYCHVKGQYVKSYYISFNAENKTISVNGGGFITSGLNPIRFQSGMYYHITGSVLNNKVVKSLTVTNSEITLDSSETLFDEEAGSLVTIHMVDIDDAFKSAIIDYIGYKLKTGKDKGVSSEKFDDYSVSYADSQKILSEIFHGFKRIKSSE